MIAKFTVFLTAFFTTFIRYIGVLVKLIIPKKISLLARLVALVCMIILGWVIWDKMGIQKETLEGLSQIDPIPHTQDLLARKRYAEAYDYLSFFMDYDYVKSNGETVKLYNDIKEKRNDYYYKLKKISDGIVTGESDELEGQAAAVISDFFVIGDARDLIKEGMKFYKGEDADELTAALSAIGVAATVGTAMTAGGTATVKPALSFLKMMNKAGQVPSWLRQYLIKSAKVIKQTKNIDHLTELAGNISGLLKTTGLRSTIALLNKADSVDSLKSLTKFGTHFGDKTAVLLDIAEDKSIDVFYKMETVPKDIFLETATYGKQGIATLGKVGFEKFQAFLINAKITARTTKVAYKHHNVIMGTMNTILRHTIGLIPTWLLGIAVMYCSALIVRKGSSPSPVR